MDSVETEVTLQPSHNERMDIGWQEFDRNPSRPVLLRKKKLTEKLRYVSLLLKKGISRVAPRLKEPHFPCRHPLLVMVTPLFFNLKPFMPCMWFQPFANVIQEIRSSVNERTYCHTAKRNT